VKGLRRFVARLASSLFMRNDEDRMREELEDQFDRLLRKRGRRPFSREPLGGSDAAGRRRGDQVRVVQAPPGTTASRIAHPSIGVSARIE
jgi:hypothetical protein